MQLPENEFPAPTARFVGGSGPTLAGPFDPKVMEARWRVMLLASGRRHPVAFLLDRVAWVRWRFARNGTRAGLLPGTTDFAVIPVGSFSRQAAISSHHVCRIVSSFGRVVISSCRLMSSAALMVSPDGRTTS